MTPAEDAIERFLAMFGEPKTTNPQRFLDEYAKALTGIEADILERAVDRIMRTAKFWPRPAEVIDEATHIAAEKYRYRPVDWDAVDAERKAGWTFSDLSKRPVTAESRAAVHAMVDEMKRNIAEKELSEAVAKVAPDWHGVTADEFEDMQRGSPNQRLHRK
jgi:hypothetical protein